MPLCSEKALCVVTVVFACICVIAHLLLGAAAAWGFQLAANASNSGANDAYERAAFLGLMAVYYSLFGVWLALSELRLRRTRVIGFLLRPFAFLNSYLGRGCFELYCGTTFLVLKWDPQHPEVARAAGGLEIAVGILSILLVLGRVVKDPVEVSVSDTRNHKGDESQAGGSSAATKIKWGEASDGDSIGAPTSPASGHSAVSEWKQQAASSGSEGSDAVPSTPAPLLAGAGSTRNLASLSERISISTAVAPQLPKSKATQEADGVVTQRNPFLAAAAGNVSVTVPGSVKSSS